MGLLSKALSFIRKGEGDVKPGPWFLPISGGWLPVEVGSNLNWWQNGFSISALPSSSIVEACVGAYAQTVAMCPGTHWRFDSETNGRTRVDSSALSRIMKAPNTYQSISDFLLNGVRGLYSQGNMYALALRNNRYEIDSLHLMNPRGCSANIAYNGEIFYSLSGNPIIERMIGGPLIVPQRDVLHIRLNTSQFNPLLGESPIVAAARDIAVGEAMSQQQLQFFLNQARPSIVLQTDMGLDAATVTALRDRWNDQTRGLGAGNTPILTNGLKVAPVTFNNVDSQLVQAMKMTDQRVALTYRIPMQILGVGGSGPANTTEALMNDWLAGALGFCLNHIEEAFGNLFELKGQPDEYLELDTSILMRSALKDKVSAYQVGVLGGIFAPDEARAEFSLPKVKKGFGEEPRVQSQVVPLSAAGAIPTSPAAPAAPASKPPALAPPPDKEFVDDNRDLTGEDIESFFSELNVAHDQARIS